MARQLTSKYLERFLSGGIYHNLIEVIKQDPELEFEIRVKNEVMVYFEKCLLLTIGCNSTQPDNIRMLDIKYITNRRDKLRLTTPLQTSEDFQDIEKIKRYFSEAKALSRNYKRHEEFVVQQAFKSDHSSFDDDYLVVDMEWRPDQSDIPPYERISRTRIDLIVVSNRPNAEGKHDVFLAELKCGLNATDGVSGMEDHVSKSKEIMRKPVICDKLMTDVAAIIKQKRLLGLISGTPVKYNFSARPKMMFILAYRNDSERQAFERKVSSLEAKGYEIVAQYLPLGQQSDRAMTFGGISNDTDFKKACRKHQAWFREKKLGCSMGENPRTVQAKYEDMDQFMDRKRTFQDIAHLTDGDASALMNFVPAFHDEIAAALERRFGRIPTSHDLMNDMLRSENIPWNIFVPMMQDSDAAVSVLKQITKRDNISKITDWGIEYAPKTLDDNTAFDAYVRYQTTDGQTGIIGFEVKYTEEGYKVHDAELARIRDANSSYSHVTKLSGCFKYASAEQFNNPEFIQIWRNHMLAMSMAQKGYVSYYDSVTVYPSGNTHFHSSEGHVGALEAYSKKLTANGLKTFHYITFEDLFALLAKIYQGEKNQAWIEYLRTRYIVDVAESVKEFAMIRTSAPTAPKTQASAPTAPKTQTAAPQNNQQVAGSLKQKLKELISVGRKEWVLNLVDYSLDDMLRNSKAKASFTAHAPIASMEAAHEKYHMLDSFKAAYNKERGSNNDQKNSAYWYFCHGVKPGDIIYLAKGPSLYAYGVITGDKVVTDRAAKEHYWNIEWHVFKYPLFIPRNLATPFFVNLSINDKKRQALHNAIF